MNFIIWNPDSSIIDLGFYALRWYSLLFASGFIISYLILKKIFIRENLQVSLLDSLTIYIVTATVIGARLGHCLFYEPDYYLSHPLEIILPFRFSPEFTFTGFQGLASHGGALGILFSIIVFSYRKKIPLYWLLDTLSLIFPIACACIRFGNLMNSEIIGRPTNLPWAFVFVQIDDVPRHPGQLYEAIAYLLLAVILYFIDKKIKNSNGLIFGIFLVGAFTLRFLIEFLKEDQSDFEQGMVLNMGQLLSLPFILYGIWLIATRTMKRKLHSTENDQENGNRRTDKIC